MGRPGTQRGSSGCLAGASALAGQYLNASCLVLPLTAVLVSIDGGNAVRPRPHPASKVQQVGRVAGDVARLEHQGLRVRQVVGVQGDVEPFVTCSSAGGKVVDNRQPWDGRVVERVPGVLALQQGALRRIVLIVEAQIRSGVLPLRELVLRGGRKAPRRTQ